MSDRRGRVPPSCKSASERRPLQLADIRWIRDQNQTCADCLRPQRFDYWADHDQWERVVGVEVTLCIECYLRRCDAANEREGLMCPEQDPKTRAYRTIRCFKTETRGKCPVCHYSFRLRSDGSVMKHTLYSGGNKMKEPCKGSHQHPA